jgi:peptidoglycan/xylan/chitin deacetylase (PgdA/CDA1 family)
MLMATNGAPREHLGRVVLRAARGIARAGLATRSALSVARFLGVRRATIFTLHRFTDGPSAVLGTDVSMLRSVLAQLRRQRVVLMRLRDLAWHVRTRTPLAGPTAVFTVDDGYHDFAELAAPIFAGFDCPATVFLVTEFTAGRQWCWWDRIHLAFARSPLRRVVVQVDGRTITYALGSASERTAGSSALVEALKWVRDSERRRVVRGIGGSLAVELSETPERDYRGLTWDEVRALARTGVDFAPHSLTHPMLSRQSPARARHEILQSWADLRTQLDDPSPVFGYPNGSTDSFGEREMSIVRDGGLMGAVAIERRYIDPVTCADEDRFRLSRFPTPEDSTSAGYFATGMAWDR